MNLPQWFKANTKAEHERVAKACKTTVPYLRKISTGNHGKASPGLAEKLAKASETSPFGPMTEIHILYPERADNQKVA